MQRRKAPLLTLFLILAVVVTAGIVATGQLEWRSSTGATAAESQPLVIAQEVDSATVPSQELLSQLYTQILPSVVNIQVTTEGGISDPNLGIPSAPAQGQGSGWMWDAEGHIVTNNHVVENAAQIMVFFHNGFWAEATLVAADPQADLAVIKVTPPMGVEIQPLPLAADVPPVGYYVLAFGSPFGLAGTMTQGIVTRWGAAYPWAIRLCLGCAIRCPM